MKKKFKLGKDILTLAILTLITALTWAGFAIWSAATQNTINKVTQEQMAPLNPQLKKEVFESELEGIAKAVTRRNESS